MDRIGRYFTFVFLAAVVWQVAFIYGAIFIVLHFQHPFSSNFQDAGLVLVPIAVGAAIAFGGRFISDVWEAVPILVTAAAAPFFALVITAVVVAVVCQITNFCIDLY